MRGEYCLQQAGIKAQNAYHSFENSSGGQAYRPAMPLIGSLPSKLPATLLSGNAVILESQLFGIGANNLVSPQRNHAPRLTSLPILSFYELPKLIAEPQCGKSTPQRPFPVPY